MEDKLKALANDILEQCQKQGLTFSEMRTLSAMLHVKSNGRTRMFGTTSEANT